MKGNQKLLFIAILLVLLLLTGCISNADTQEKGVTFVDNVSLLFSYSPSCPHCTYQRPIISEFERTHPEINVIQVKYNDLNYEQRSLIAGTSGHPVMVFYSGNHVRQVVRETPIGALEEEYDAFKKQLGRTKSSKITTGSYKRCK